MLTPWKENYDQPRQHIKNQKHYFVNKIRLVKAMVFPVIMYGYESGTVKKAECCKIDALWCWRRIDALWCWRRLLRVPWTARRSSQSILKEIRPECSLEGLMLNLDSNTLVSWCKELTHLKRPSCWERLRAGKEGDGRGWGGWMASLTQWTWVWVNSGSWWWTGRPGVCGSFGGNESDITERLNWTESYFLVKRLSLVLVLIVTTIVATHHILSNPWVSKILHCISNWFPLKNAREKIHYFANR